MACGEPTAARIAMCQRAVEHVRRVTPISPTAAIILGSGLGALADQICDPVQIPFAEIPGFAKSTISGHLGRLILGHLAGTTVVALAGRLHRYEGWSHDEVIFPIEVMAALGAKRLIASNAAGGLNPKLRVGDLVIIADHINWIGGISASRCDRATDSPQNHGQIYDSRMSSAAIKTAVSQRFNAYRGTYLATLGPTYETRAECRMMRRIGADVVGMSTVPEVLTAVSLKLRVLGISLVSNVANPDRAIKADHAEVLEAGEAAAVKMEAIVRSALKCT